MRFSVTGSVTKHNNDTEKLNNKKENKNYIKNTYRLIGDMNSYCSCLHQFK